MNFQDKKRTVNGFTILELIVVIIVIAILVTITAVSYSLITQSAAEQALQADIRDAASKLTRYKADNGGYPSTLSDAGVGNSDGKVFGYTYHPSTNGYCLTITKEDMSYFVVNTNTEPKEGTECPAP